MVDQPNYRLLEEFNRIAVEAFQAGNHLQSALISFQETELLLRIMLRGLGRARSVPAKTLKRCADEEQSVARLIDYLVLLHPSNPFSARLTELNRRRNKFVHQLFYAFQSVDELTNEITDFCMTSQALNREIADFLSTNHDLD